MAQVTESFVLKFKVSVHLCPVSTAGSQSCGADTTRGGLSTQSHEPCQGAGRAALQKCMFSNSSASLCFGPVFLIFLSILFLSYSFVFVQLIL